MQFPFAGSLLPHLLLAVTLRISPVNSFSQRTAPTPASERLQSFEQKQLMETDPGIGSLDFLSIGPVIMSGRVTDLEGNPDDPNEFYAAFASGGLWRTGDMGESFEPLFDHEATMSMGDIAVDWNHGGIIWVGTGENNASRSSFAGTGVYKSTDLGKTWQHAGLAETHHIGRIVLHPDNPDIVWVAAMGHLFGRNPERGVYRTTDGGRTWIRTLFTDDRTGAIDLVINPLNPDILYAAMWDRQAWMWDRRESGPGSGIYKSVDGGLTWKKISGEEYGFPSGEYTGRIGLAIYPRDPEILYAYLDNKTPVAQKLKKGYSLDDLRGMSPEEFSTLDPEMFDKFLKKSRFPPTLSYDSLEKGMEQGVYSPQTLLAYKTDTNYIPEPRILGAEIYRTDNGGESWYRTHKKNFKRPLMRYSYGYYFGEIRVFPDDPDRIILGGLVISTSKNGGKKLKSHLRLNVHLDQQAFWISPADPDYVLNGNDGGINLSTNGGRSWEKINPIPVGQFYSINVDMHEPYNVYGGLQDNGVWMGPSTYDITAGYERSHKKYPYKMIHGGDGMQVQILEPGKTNELWIFAGSQYGHYSKRLYLPKKDGSYKSKGRSHPLYPGHTFPEEAQRFNWQAPILISPNNDSVFYMGSQRVNRSSNRGSGLMPVSGDLSEKWGKGDGPNGTVTAIDESPAETGVVYAGTDDGQVWISRDDCANWENISEGLPEGYKVYSMDASAFRPGRAYLALNGYYSDNFESHVYVTEDYGKSWNKISANLPVEGVNKILEDPVNENLLYAGTDGGLYISTDRGGSWYGTNSSLPCVPVFDLIVHPGERDLLVATHGRSIYKTNVRKLQESLNARDRGESE